MMLVIKSSMKALVKPISSRFIPLTCCSKWSFVTGSGDNIAFSTLQSCELGLHASVEDANLVTTCTYPNQKLWYWILHKWCICRHPWGSFDRQWSCGQYRGLRTWMSRTQFYAVVRHFQICIGCRLLLEIFYPSFVTKSIGCYLITV